MTEKPFHNRHLSILLLLLAWCLVVSGSLFWNQQLVQERVIENARLEADTIINKDLAYRRWATLHGGVYVRPTEQTPPNPWLIHPKRDVVTTDGDRLTLMNPAYMTRQMMTLFSQQYGVKGHITSLVLKNPNNAPDDWERSALQQFNHGAIRVSQVAVIDQQRYLRLILPMKMEQGCLKCHADTGIPVGGIRGGISAAVPLKPHELLAAGPLQGLRLAHGGIWLVGVLALVGGNILHKRQQESIAAVEKALNASNIRFDALTQASPTGMFQTDPEGNCLFVNPHWCQMAGISLHEAEGTGWRQAIHPDDRELVYNEWNASVNECRPFALEYRFLRPDGGITWVYGQSRAIHEPDNGLVGYVGAVTDITKRKQAEQALQDAKESAERLNQVKNEFLATISHELRTPLNAAMGGVQLLEMTDLNDEQQQYVAMVNIGASQELALVNDLLDLTVIEAGGVRIMAAPFPLRRTIQEVATMMEPECLAKGLRLQVTVAEELPDTLVGDERRVMQSIRILLHNACKFTDQGSIMVSAGHVAQLDQQIILRISVIDTGIGIPPEMIDQIFEPFIQADMSNTRRHGGTGLGLSICSHLAAAMGGRVSVESRVGEGSAFHLELPFELPLPVSPCNQAATASSPRCSPGSR